MRLGAPSEIETDEYRVGMTPAGVRELVEHGHEVLVQAGAGEGSAISDEQYAAQGAQLAPDAVFAQVELIVKVKESQPGVHIEQSDDRGAQGLRSDRRRRASNAPGRSTTA